MKRLYLLTALAVAACSTPKLIGKPQPTTIYLYDLSGHIAEGNAVSEDNDPSSLTPLEYCRSMVGKWAADRYGNRLQELTRYRAGNAILQHLADMCLRKNMLNTIDTNGNGRLDQGDDKDGDNNLTDLDGIVE